MLRLWVASLPPPTSPPTARLQLPGQRPRSQQWPQSRPVNQALNASPKAQTEGPLTVGGTGTTNYIPIWTNSTTLGNSILYQTGNNVGIGNTSPAGPLDVTGNTFIPRHTAVARCRHRHILDGVQLPGARFARLGLQ